MFHRRVLIAALLREVKGLVLSSGLFGRNKDSTEEGAPTMKSPTNVVDDCDDIFGPPRTYATGFCPPKSRPSMISAKYRQKEERRKVLKISINKLKKIEDPEASLCRSVLINNTMKRLQKEARDEKVQKQQLNYPRYDNDTYLSIKNEFIKNEAMRVDSEDFTSSDAKIMDSLKADFESDFDQTSQEESSKLQVTISEIVEENLSNLTSTGDFSTSDLISAGNESVNVVETNARKRPFEEVDDCDVHDVLSQFYMPPTPRMLTCIDEDDEDVNVVDDEPIPKRTKLELPTQVHHLLDQQGLNLGSCYNNNDNDRLCGFNLPVATSLDENVNTSNPYSSCGHASMFNDLQTNVFHSLIASLET